MQKYETTNYNLAVYLFAKGIDYTGIKGEGIKTFTFKECPERVEASHQYTSRKNCVADFWDLTTAQTILKNEIYN